MNQNQKIQIIVSAILLRLHGATVQRKNYEVHISRGNCQVDIAWGSGFIMIDMASDCDKKLFEEIKDIIFER